MTTATVPTLSPTEASLDAWQSVGRVIRIMGSTLELEDLTLRVRKAMDEELGHADCAVCLLDLQEGIVRRVDPSASPRSLELRWPVSEELLGILREDRGVSDLPSNLLPPELCGSYLAALRLLDGESVVGFLLLHESSIETLADPDERSRLETVGRLMGSAYSRALVHQSMVEVTSRADASQRMQQQILDHVSHEFNTPLMIIKSSAEFAHSGDEEERELFLDMHSQALERLEELVQGVLEVARSSTKGVPQILNMEDTLQAIFAPILESRDRAGEITRTWIKLTDGVVSSIEPDALSLSAEHLLRNATRFALEQGGDVALAIYADNRARWARQNSNERLDAGLAALKENRDLEFPDVDPLDVLVIEVYDSGLGIPEDEMELVFEPFTQARNSPLRGVSGAGMGLPTCERLVVEHGGELVVTSREGEGSVFTILIPAKREG